MNTVSDRRKTLADAYCSPRIVRIPWAKQLGMTDAAATTGPIEFDGLIEVPLADAERRSS